MGNKIIGILIIILSIVAALLLILKKDNSEANFYAKLDNPSLEIENGNTVKLSVNTNLSNPTIRYVSNNTNIVEVDDNGLITTKRIGTTIIYVSVSSDDYKDILRCNISVIKNSNAIKIDSFKLKEGSIVITKGYNYTIPYIMEPSNATIDSLDIESLDKDVIRVNKDNTISAVSIGNTDLKLIVNTTLAVNTKVYVIDKLVNTDFYILPSIINFKEKNIEIKEEENIDLGLILEPSNADLSLLNYEYDKNIISIVDNKVYGLKEGNTIIKVKGINDVENSINVNIKPKTVEVTKINLNSKKVVTINEGEVSQIITSVEPSNATYKELTFSSSNNNICTVDSNGVIKGINNGRCSIDIKAHNGIKETINVNINVSYTAGTGTLNAISCNIGDKNCIYQPGFHKYKTSDGLYYLVYVPHDVKESTKKTLHIFMHGTGEGGTNYNSLVKYGIGKLITLGNNYDFFVMLTQKPDSNVFNNSTLMLFLNSFNSIYGSNVNKMTLGGYSGGSFGLTSGIKSNLNMFSTGLSIAPCSSYASVDTNGLGNTKVKVFIGSSDTCGTNATSICNKVNTINNASCEIMNGYSHNNKIVTDVYSQTEIIDFIS